MVEFGQYPLVYQLLNGVPVGIAEASSIIVSSVSANTYQGLTGTISFTGVVQIGDATSVGTSLIDNDTPNYPLIKPLAANTDNFVGFSPVDGTVTIGWAGSPLSVSHGGTNATTETNARANLGLTIGTHVQAQNTNLQALADLPGGLVDKKILVGGTSNSLTSIDAPTTDNTFLKYTTAGGFSWAAGGSVSYPDFPGRIPYISDSTTLASQPWLNIETGTGRFNVCEVYGSVSIIVGNTDTTVARLSAGDLTVGGNRIFRVGGTDIPVADGGTGKSSFFADQVIFGDDFSQDATFTFDKANKILKSPTLSSTVVCGVDLFENGTNIDQIYLTQTNANTNYLQKADAVAIYETTGYSRTNFALTGSLANYTLTSTFNTFKTNIGNNQGVVFADGSYNLNTNASLTFDGTTLKSPTVCGTTVCGTTIFENGTNISSKYLTTATAATTYTPLTVTGLFETTANAQATYLGKTTFNNWSGSLALSAGLKDVIIGTLSNGQVLKWNGSNWANSTDATGAGFTYTDLKQTNDGFFILSGASPIVLGNKPTQGFSYKIPAIGENGLVSFVDYGATRSLTDTSPGKFTVSAANYYSALLVDQLSSVDHFNENSYIFYAEVNTLSATTISATTYYNLPSSTMVWSSAINATNAERIRKYVKNTTGSTIAKGRAVTVVSATGDNALIAPLSSVNTHVPEAVGFSNHVFGLTETQILNDDFGYIITEGLVAGTGGGVNALDTSLFSAGDILYVSSNGLLSNVRPPAPYEAHPIGYVLRSHANVGSIYVKIETVPEINDIVGFNLASSILNGDLITYDLTTSTFVNRQSIDVSGLIKGGSLSATNLSATNARITSLSATTLSAITYLNLPSGIATWNANALQGVSVTSTAPTTNNVLIYNGTVWTPSSAISLASISATNLSATNATITSLSATTVSATTYRNLPQTDASSIGGTKVTIFPLPPNNNDILTYDNSVSAWINSPTARLSSLTATTVSSTNLSSTNAVINSLSATTLSATNYLNLPSGTATWNASALRGFTVTGTTPVTNNILMYNGTVWTPSSAISLASVSSTTLSATTSFNIGSATMTPSGASTIRIASSILIPSAIFFGSGIPSTATQAAGIYYTPQSAQNAPPAIYQCNQDNLNIYANFGQNKAVRIVDQITAAGGFGGSGYEFDGDTFIIQHGPTLSATLAAVGAGILQVRNAVSSTTVSALSATFNSVSATTYRNTPAEIGIACSDETTNLTSGLAKVTFRMPYAMKLTNVRANVNTAPSGSTIIVDINEAGASIFSTRLTIASGSKTSVGGTAHAFSDTSLADDAEITIDIDQVGSTTAGKGLKVWLIGTRA